MASHYSARACRPACKYPPRSHIPCGPAYCLAASSLVLVSSAATRWLALAVCLCSGEHYRLPDRFAVATGADAACRELNRGADPIHHRDREAAAATQKTLGRQLFLPNRKIWRCAASARLPVARRSLRALHRDLRPHVRIRCRAAARRSAIPAPAYPPGNQPVQIIFRALVVLAELMHGLGLLAARFAPARKHAARV